MSQLPSLFCTKHIVKNKYEVMVFHLLQETIMTISMFYKSNSFHNFEHASHIVIYTMKLLDRIRSQEQAKFDLSTTHDS
jgi:hypothetical protein